MYKMKQILIINVCMILIHVTDNADLQVLTFLKLLYCKDYILADRVGSRHTSSFSGTAMLEFRSYSLCD